MKRKIEIGLLIALIGLGVVVFLLTHKSEFRWEDSSLSTGKEITIRNATEEIIHYQIWPYDSSQRPKKKVLKVGAVHRYPGEVSMDIIFERGESIINRLLVSGKPYVFRYDENNKLKIYEGSHGRADAPDLAPFVSTPMAVVEKMLELADVDQNDILYDLGCGDGRIVITAAKKYGARGVGVDIVPQRIEESKRAARKAGIEKLVEFRLADVIKVDISGATVVALYLLPESNELIRPKLEKQLKPGALVVSHNYQIPGWEEKEVDYIEVKDEEGKDHTIFLYKR